MGDKNTNQEEEMRTDITYKHAGCIITVHQDDTAQGPSEDQDERLFLVASHRDFYVPEPGEKRVPDDPEELIERYKKSHWIFPLEAYIHGGVHLSFGHEGDYPDRRWDVSQLGFVFVSKKEWRLQKSAKKAAASHIQYWNDYLSGNVYGWTVEDEETGEDGDSVWGYYGYDETKEDSYMIKDNAKPACDALREKIDNLKKETEIAMCIP